MITIARLPLTGPTTEFVYMPDNAVPLEIIDAAGLPSLAVTIDDSQVNNLRTVQMRVAEWTDAEGQIDFDLSAYYYVGRLGDQHFWLSNV